MYIEVVVATSPAQSSSSGWIVAPLILDDIRKNFSFWKRNITGASCSRIVCACVYAARRSADFGDESPFCTRASYCEFDHLENWLPEPVMKMSNQSWPSG